jgi:hypothetical protein
VNRSSKKWPNFGETDGFDQLRFLKTLFGYSKSEEK